MKKQKGLKYRKRKPDLETENLRIWTSIAPEAKEVKKIAEQEEHKIEIDCGSGDKMRLMGFTKMIDQKIDQIVFAYKFKNQDMVIMHYIPDKLTKENSKKIKKIMTKIQAITEIIGYEMIDAKEFTMTVADETKRLKKKNTQI